MPLRFPFIIAALTFALSWGALPWSTAEAAPQVLGLVASNGVPTPLTCKDGECSAHFSAFCLQEAQDAPSAGTAYAPAPGATVTLIATAADGESIRLPGERYLQFSSLIGFTSVRIGVPRTTIEALGAIDVAVEIGPAVSLVPAALLGTSDPFVADEIALATGPARAAAARIFEEPGAASDAARITSLFINALPAGELESSTMRDRLWQAKAAHPAIAGASHEGLLAAQRLYDSCRVAVESRSANSLRSCLELRHADLMATANHRFWDSLGGS